MKLIVGLGNPDKKYEKTRHNVGFMVVDNYLGEVKWQEKYNAKYYKKIINDETVIFVKPLTYMNNSGNAVREFVNFYNIDMNDILVIQDDLDIELGSYKLKNNSSSGGHNGIKSIIKSLGSDSFNRLKIGIYEETNLDTIDYVLKKFSKKSLEKIENNYIIFSQIIDCFINNGIEKTMNLYNRK